MEQVSMSRVEQNHANEVVDETLPLGLRTVTVQYGLYGTVVRVPITYC